ncbi:hypothetical protein KUTeg_005378 [Tegillarca granosa]|uniref:BCL2/adenovirus E1B 19 kDa protein-interacting protein 3 n=1 Tax=Tegillarca granosa TaxID=220873 RepID=A0ABQ9FJL0_TEGGR|nr:hypothetical protein KUTeg_005378 [Tegillarca granosa]
MRHSFTVTKKNLLMATIRRQDEDLQDSWVELNGKNGDPADPQSAYNGQMERLLIEAQKESREASRNTSPKISPAGSPRTQTALTNQSETQEDRDPGTDWVWDWSSRPEVNPPSGFPKKFKRPSDKHTLSVRKSGLFNLENLPTLIVSHACTFLLGAAV